MLLILMHLQNLVEIHLFIHKILSRNEILTSFKGRNSVKIDKNGTLNNPKLDVVNINACAKFRQNPFIHPEDIEQKRHSDVIQETKFCNELTTIDA